MSMTSHRSENYLLKRLGMAGFLFFMAKGLAWLVIPALMYLISMTN